MGKTGEKSPQSVADIEKNNKGTHMVYTESDTSSVSKREPSFQLGFQLLKRSIVFFVLGIVTVTLAFEGISLYFQYQQSISDAKQKITNHVIAVREHTSRIIESVDLALKHTVHTYQEHWLPEKKSDREIYDSLVGIKSHLPQLRDIIIINRKGITIHDSGIFPARQLDLSDRIYFKIHQEKTDIGLYVGQPLKGRNSGKWFLSTSRRINNNENGFGGVVGAIIDPRYFWEFYDLLSQAHGVQTLFYHQNGTIISTSGDMVNNKISLVGQPVSKFVNVLIPFKGKDNKGKTTVLQGKLLRTKGEQIGALLFLEKIESKSEDLVIAAFVSTHVALEGFKKSLFNAISFSLALIFIALALIFVTFRQIDARRRSSEALLTAVMEKKAAQAEVIEINTELQTLNSELEQRIRERTVELSDALDNLRLLQQQIVEQEKLASLGQLVAGITHEVNSPLGAALTAVTALNDVIELFEKNARSGTLSEDEFYQRLKKIKTGKSMVQTNIEQAARLIRSFKQISADRNISEIREINLCAYVKDIVASLAPQVIKTGAKIKIECRRDDIYCTIEPGALAQVLTNLIMNALMHGLEQVSDGVIVIKIKSSRNNAMLTVKDNGKGMSSDILDSVFDPFFTTKRGAGGTGLGMHIVYNLVKVTLGGEIVVNSSPGEGTKVFISVPLLPLPA